MATKTTLDFLTKLIVIATGLAVTLIFLGSFVSEDVRQNVIDFTEVLIANGAYGKFILLTVVVGSLDACWQFNYATYKAKGINSHWIKVIQIKYPYQKWLKPIYAILGIAIVFTAVF